MQYHFLFNIPFPFNFHLLLFQLRRVIKKVHYTRQNSDQKIIKEIFNIKFSYIIDLGNLNVFSILCRQRPVFIMRKCQHYNLHTENLTSKNAKVDSMEHVFVLSWAKVSKKLGIHSVEWSCTGREDLPGIEHSQRLLYTPVTDRNDRIPLGQWNPDDIRTMNLLTPNGQRQKRET